VRDSNIVNLSHLHPSSSHDALARDEERDRHPDWPELTAREEMRRRNLKLEQAVERIEASWC
jgi:hypothetical protein